MAIVMVPDGPRCVRCGHHACPCCIRSGHAWCDDIRCIDPWPPGPCHDECVYVDAWEIVGWAASLPDFEAGDEISIAPRRT